MIEPSDMLNMLMTYSGRVHLCLCRVDRVHVYIGLRVYLSFFKFVYGLHVIESMPKKKTGITVVHALH